MSNLASLKPFTIVFVFLFSPNLHARITFTDQKLQDHCNAKGHYFDYDAKRCTKLQLNTCTVAAIEKEIKSRSMTMDNWRKKDSEMKTSGFKISQCSFSQNNKVLLGYTKGGLWPRYRTIVLVE